MTVYISNNADSIIQTAAKSFSALVKEITGTEYFVQKVDDFSADLNKGFVFSTFATLGKNINDFNDEKIRLMGEGFCVREKNGKIFVLSHISRGVYYGVFELLERNLEVVFSRGAKEEAVAYTSGQKAVWKQTDFWENTPFAVRSWNICGVGTDGKGHLDDGTAEYLSRNKSNAVFHAIDENWRKYGLFHNGKRVARVQVFDDMATQHPEYFMMDADGNPKKAFGGYESFPNYYNAEAAKFLAKRLVAGMENANPEDTFHWTMPDNSYFYMLENGKKLHELPFTCDDGTIVYPNENNYKSTVYFNFLNRVVQQANVLRPNTYLQVFAYIYTEPAPKIQIDEHLIVKVAPITTNERYSYESEKGGNATIKKNIEAWSKKTKNLQLYTYWTCFTSTRYTRPILRTVQENLLWFQSLGVKGITIEGTLDCSWRESLSPSQKSAHLAYDMNEAYFWVISKLLWNPRLDIDTLLSRYAKIVYKECAEEMLAYFRLLQKGWESKDANVWYTTGGDVYYLQMIVGAGVADEILETLTSAVHKATTPSVKRKISSILEVVASEIDKYKNFVQEDAFATYYQGNEKELFEEKAMDYVNNPSSPWNKAKPLTVLRYSRTMEYYPKQANFSCRILYDEKNLYFGYTLFDETLAEERKDGDRKRYFREDGSEINACAETYIGGDIFNQSVYYGYISGFMGVTREEQGEFYKNDGAIKRIPLPEGVRTEKYVHLSKTKENRYHFHVQVIPFSAIGESITTVKPYGSFSYVSNKYGCAGWMGYGLWSKQNFQKFNLDERKEDI